MARQQHYTYRTSPYRHSPRVAPTFKGHPRTPVASKIHLANRSRLQTRNSNTNRYLPSGSKLAVITEEPVDDEPWSTRDPYRDLDAYREGNDTVHYEDEDDDDITWDDETTLVAMLEDEKSDQRDREELAVIADKLKGAMADCGPGMKQYLASTLIPTSSRLREVHAVLEEDVDITFGTGILAFDEVSKRIEALVLQDEDDTKNMFLDVKKNVNSALGRLKALEAEREQLWAGFEVKINEHAERVTTAVKSLPEHVEQTIAYLEKRSKELEKDDGGYEKLRTMLLQKRAR